MAKLINCILFSDKLENSDDILTLKNSFQNVKTFHCGNTDFEYPMAEADLRKVIPTIGPNLNKLGLVGFPHMCYGIILDFIKLRKSTLKELHFFYCNFSDDFLKSVSLIKKINLTSFSLRGCRESTNDGSLKLRKSQKNIKELNLNFWKGLSDESLMIISDILPNIKLLRITNLEERVTYVSLHFIFLILFFTLL